MLAKRRSLIYSDEKRKALQNVAAARGRLKGALKTIKSSSDESTSSDDTVEESQVKRARADSGSDVYHPYIVTLFNRGIDIARFRENAPLFPMCRAWVKNEPRGTPEVVEVDRKSRSAIKREHNPDIVEQLQNGEIDEITEMPRPEPAGDRAPFLLHTPEPVEDVEIDQSSLDRAELMQEHIVQWKKVRKSWIAHRQKYTEARYGTSLQLLEALKK